METETRHKIKGLWTMSPSSALLVQRCIEASGKSDENNKWALAFNKRVFDPVTSSIGKENTGHRDDIPPENLPPICLPEESNNKAPDQSGINEIICEFIETDLAAKWPRILSECTKTGDAFVSVATNVSEASLEKFCNQIYNNADSLQGQFVINYVRSFLPTYLKKRQSRLSLDMIVTASKHFPLEFNTVFIPCLVKELEIPSTILQNYVQTLNAKEKADFLAKLCDIKLSSEEFSYHLVTLCSLYKDCETITPCIQSYVFSNIEEQYEFHSNDKSFGKLVLAFMQNCNVKLVNVKALGRIIASHQSVFRRPCMNKFDSEFKLK